MKDLSKRKDEKSTEKQGKRDWLREALESRQRYRSLTSLGDFMELGPLRNEIISMIERRKKAKERKAREKREYRERLEELALKYLLPISVKDYADSVGKNPSDFNQKNVCATYLGRYNLEEVILKCKKKMIKKAQKWVAEVVVEVEPPSFYQKSYYQPIYMMGTALIPKKKTEE